jgi:hypothetical protein
MLRLSTLPSALALAGALALTVVPAATAAHGDYAEWSLDGQTGNVSVPVKGFPAAELVTTSNNPTTPSGNSAFLNADTPFGALFGSSRGRGYLSVRTAAGGSPSTTVITFDSPAPAGRWGFALGDIDADRMTVKAIGRRGPLTAAELGWQGAFNYCHGSPRPPSCTRPPFTDKPHWDPSTSTLHGHVTDTDGASGWFRPTVAVKSLTLIFSVQSGIPLAQVWIAALPTHPNPRRHHHAPVPSGGVNTGGGGTQPLNLNVPVR